MKRSHQVVLLATVFVVAVTTAIIIAADSTDAAADNTAVAAARPTLSVSLTRPQRVVLPLTLSASGNISAWQEASIGNETNGLRLDQVLVNVGDIVKAGQLLASFDADTVRSELAQSQAAVAEAEALLTEATDDVKRAAELQASGALSARQIQQYSTAEKTARARLNSAQASLHSQHLRLEQTRVLAPDNGIISARDATVGAVLPPGQQLFRLIRGGRLEWRAEVSAQDLPKLQPGQVVYVTPVGGETIIGSLRMVAPVVDTQSRNALVYVDLPLDNSLRAGSFARGRFELGTTKVLTLPQTAVLLRDGFSYVMQVGEDGKVRQIKVSTGRRTADLVEISGGITAADQVVLTGGAFLGDGDLVQIVPPQQGAQPSATTAKPAGTPAALAVQSDDVM
ncbi:efflux RND transporter periplasmic adaptor subunit [Rheinheimera sp. YQF-2]|uniref:Efflux RND transporter periplasmic adaptor subunit n=1 Tax=Rheinheimera lutimaris TaxID=2740584 RepID=A0A7Y5EIV1_9GAMM|nr:efflux RND transporter periplasmic adaptor subunit [Rheinheimera lutimaris]NRQ43157.1 efflux RND transporter periplasmic adaptor subunit [Rheinheimera lutimaris]